VANRKSAGNPFSFSHDINADCQKEWNLRKFADSRNRSEKVEKSVWLAEHIGTLPTDVFLSIISKLA